MQEPSHTPDLTPLLVSSSPIHKKVFLMNPKKAEVGLKNAMKKEKRKKMKILIWPFLGLGKDSDLDEYLWISFYTLLGSGKSKF